MAPRGPGESGPAGPRRWRMRGSETGGVGRGAACRSVALSARVRPVRPRPLCQLSPAATLLPGPVVLRADSGRRAGPAGAEAWCRWWLEPSRRAANGQGQARCSAGMLRQAKAPGAIPAARVPAARRPGRFTGKAMANGCAGRPSPVSCRGDGAWTGAASGLQGGLVPDISAAHWRALRVAAVSRRTCRPQSLRAPADLSDRRQRSAAPASTHRAAVAAHG